MRIFVIICGICGAYTVGTFFGGLLILLFRLVYLGLYEKNSKYSFKKDSMAFLRNYMFNLKQLFVFRGDTLDG